MAIVTDASSGIWAPDRRTLYLAAEQEQGWLHALRVIDGRMAEVSNARTGGSAPCHLALSGDGSRLAAANYESGSVAVFMIDAAGRPASDPIVHRLAGCGPCKARQAAPHAHWVGFAPRTDRLYCVDLGSDTIWRFDEPRARPAVAFRAPPGSGPRHLAFHPHLSLAYLVSELASTLTSLAVEPSGALREIAIWSTLPPTTGESLGGHILLNQAADRLYVTNRGHDSVAVFAVDSADARLLQHVPSGGASPRFMLLLESQRRLLVANEEGGSVRQFRVLDNGELQNDATVDVPGAVFLIEAA